jgi:N-acetyl-anhydromuramyl-L-alanine amidase AmpD
VDVRNELPLTFLGAAHFTPAKRTSISWLVLHSMEAAEASTTAEAVAQWFAGQRGTAPRASAHYNVDDESIVQSVRDEDIAWHAPGANAHGIGIEHAGYARHHRDKWFDPFSARMLTLSARLSAHLAARWRIPVRFVDREGLRRGDAGITTHLEVTAAFRKSDHMDPGVSFPMERYLELVRSFLLAEQ